MEGMNTCAKGACPPSDRVYRTIHSEEKNRNEIMKQQPSPETEAGVCVAFLRLLAHRLHETLRGAPLRKHAVTILELDTASPKMRSSGAKRL